MAAPIFLPIILVGGYQPLRENHKPASPIDSEKNIYSGPPCSFNTSIYMLADAT